MGVDLGKLCYEQTIFTWVVKSDLLIGVKLKHVLTMGDKSPGIRPLHKETDIVPNECCRICRIYLGIITRIFHKHCHLFCSVDPMPKLTLVRSLKINIGRRRKMQAAPKMITYLYKVVCFLPTSKLSFRIRRFIFCCPKKVSLFDGMTVLEQKMVNTSRHEILVVNVWTAQTGC